MSFDPLPAAYELQRLWRERAIMDPLPAAIAPRNEQEGVAVQHYVAGLVDALPPAGFKIGATGSRMQAYLGVDAPIGGFMRAADVYQGHADLRFGDFVRPGLECEVAVRLAHDLPPGAYTLDQVMAAIGDFFAGIEIVENRYGDLTKLGTPTLVADQMYHAAAVIGGTGGIDWRALDIAALIGRIEIQGGATDGGVTSDLMGHPLNGLIWLAASPLAAAFGGLKAGQVIMLGSVTPPMWLNGPVQATVSFPPFPAVTVHLA